MHFSFFEQIKSYQLLLGFIKNQPKKGRGLVKDLACYLSLASPQVSQFISGKKIPTLDQAVCISKFFHWNELETEFFVLLVELDRSSHHLAKEHLKKKIAKIKKASLKLTNMVANTQELTENEKSKFYSSWIFSAVRLFCSIGNGKTFYEIQNSFPETKDSLENILEFLEQAKLIKKNGTRFEMGVPKTFLAKGSPYLRSHHTNWRIRAIEKSNFISDDELIYSSPMSISKIGFKKVRLQLQELIKNINKELVEHGDAEEIVCFNLDFFKIRSVE